MTTHNWINCKRPRVLIIKLYILLRFNILRRFCARLSARVFNSGHPVTYASKYFTNKPCHKLNRCISTGSTWHYTLLDTPKILHTNFFSPECHLRKKISSETKLSHSSLLRPRTLHTPFSTYKYDSKIYPIESDHFPLSQNINKPIQPKQVDSNTNLSLNIPFTLF